MKSAIAAYLQLIDNLYTDGTLHNYDFGVLITTDEEKNQGSSGVAHALEAGYVPQVALLPDSTAPGWDIEEIAKGWWRFDLVATGRSVHSGRPWEGESASIKLIHALHELKERFKDHGPRTDSLNIGSIHGGEGLYNKLPDHMVAKVEIRLTDESSAQKSELLIADLCERHGITYKTFVLESPTRPIIDDPLVDAFRDSVQHIAGKRPQEHISLGGSDAPFYAKYGVPCIVSCPLGSGHHSSKEWISAESFLQFVPILHDYLGRVAG